MENSDYKSTETDGENLDENLLKLHNDNIGIYLIQAKYKYKAMGAKDISFEVQENMFVIKRNNFWLPGLKPKKEKLHFDQPDLIVNNYGNPQSLKAYKNIPRQEAKRILMNPLLERGTYILRPSSRKHSYALSVRDMEKNSGFVVKHFLINTISRAYENRFPGKLRIYTNIETLINYFEKYGIGRNKTKLLECVPEAVFNNHNINTENLDMLLEKNCFNSVLNETHKPDSGKKITMSLKLSYFLLRSKSQMKSQIRKFLDLFNTCTNVKN